MVCYKGEGGVAGTDDEKRGTRKGRSMDTPQISPDVPLEQAQGNSSAFDILAELHLVWPPENMDWAGTTVADANTIADLTRAVLTRIGASCEWQRQDKTVVLTVAK
jgi:hypothetical protein